jgi:hypothetical protein
MSKKQTYIINGDGEPRQVNYFYAIGKDKTPQVVSAIYAINGKGEPVMVYKRSVTLNNVLKGVASWTGPQNGYDIAGGSGKEYICSTNAIKGHTYFIRSSACRYRPSGDSHIAVVQAVIGSQTVNCAQNTYSEYWGYGSATIEWVNSLVTAKTDGTLTIRLSHQGIANAAGDMVASRGFCCMLLDVTELIENMDETPTASKVWKQMGSAVFYGQREFEV